MKMSTRTAAEATQQQRERERNEAAPYGTTTMAMATLDDKVVSFMGEFFCF